MGLNGYQKLLDRHEGSVKQLQIRTVNEKKYEVYKYSPKELKTFKLYFLLLY